VLPSWIDVDFVRGATTGGVIGLAAAGLVVLIVVRSLISKIVALVLIAALAVGALSYRSSLERCLPTCSCKLATIRIPVEGHGCTAKH
jgi:hypothetical protein